MIFRGVVAAVAALAIVACNSQPSSYPGQVVKTFDGNKQLILVAGYSVKAMAVGIRAWAEVDAGAPGTLELTGPWHLLCSGKFVTPPAGNVYPETLPALDIGEGWETAPGFHAPPGHYTAVVTIPSKNATISKSFDAGRSATNAFTATYDPPGSCVVVADTRQQLDDLTSQHVQAVEIWVGRMDASPLRTQLTPLAAKAYADVTVGDRASALDAMTHIKDLADPVKDQDYDLYRDVSLSLALLTQPVPAT